jgi:uncharacterized protein YbcI
MRTKNLNNMLKSLVNEINELSGNKIIDLHQQVKVKAYMSPSGGNGRN